MLEHFYTAMHHIFSKQNVKKTEQNWSLVFCWRFKVLIFNYNFIQERNGTCLFPLFILLELEIFNVIREVENIIILKQ